MSVCMAEQELEDEMPNLVGVCVSVCMAEQELEDELHNLVGVCECVYGGARTGR